MSKRIAIIGAGSCGLGAIKSCLEESLSPVCFELTNNIGGLWNYTDEQCLERGTIYKELFSNTSREMMAFSDFPQPDSNPTYLSPKLFIDYLKMYAEKFGLMKFIQFGHKVTQVKPSEDHADSGRWLVSVTEVSTGDTTTDTFDGVLVCVGHFTYPFIPNIPGQNIFQKKQIHSQQYRKAEDYDTENVVVVGFGNSGCDIAGYCGARAKKVYFSTRRRGWLFPRTISGGLPIDAFFYRRCDYLTHLFYPNSWISSNAEKVANSTSNHEMYNLKPPIRIINQYPVINDNLPYQLLIGKVEMVNEISHFTQTGVVFTGSPKEIEIDSVIYATGFRPFHPFLEGVIDVEKESATIYKNVFPINMPHHTLAFIGLVDPDSATLILAEIQARWVTRVLSGKLELPSKLDMTKAMEKHVAINKMRFSKNHSHDLYVQGLVYADEIASFIGASPNMWKLFFTDPKLYWACLKGPILSHQFRLQGPHPWPPARQLILSYWSRLLSHMRQQPVVEIEEEKK